jgi:putative peptidoglycan lipid II flippase
MIRSFLTVSTGTLASRLLGFVRDSMIAALLGTGPVADAFLVAFQLVNVVRRLLTEGALNAALVPVWLRLRETEGEAAAGAFAGRVLATVSAVLVALSAAIGLLMPVLLIAVAPGFAGKETLHLAVDDARLMLPYLAFAGPSTVMLALFSAQSRFALTAFSPLLFNIALIAVMIVLLPARPDPGFVALALAATVGIAGLLQLAILVLRRRTGGIAKPLRVSFAADMRGFLARAVPGMVANSAPQLLIVGGAVIASSSPSAVSWLYFANRLIELPLGIVGVAMGTVMVSELTRGIRSAEQAAIARAQSHALELAAGLALPATLGLIVLSEPIVRMLFEHGAFTTKDTAATAEALVFLALALPAHVLTKALSPSFFAREDTTTPLKASMTGFAVAIIAAFTLDRLFGASGVAGGIALGAWSGTVALIRRGRMSFGFSILPATRRRLLRIAGAAIAMAALLWLATRMAALNPPAHGLAQAIPVVLLIAGGAFVYLLLLALFGIAGWRETVDVIRRGKPRDLRS